MGRKNMDPSPTIPPFERYLQSFAARPALYYKVSIKKEKGKEKQNNHFGNLKEFLWGNLDEISSRAYHVSAICKSTNEKRVKLKKIS